MQSATVFCGEKGEQTIGDSRSNQKIKIIDAGPYVVTGSVPLSEKIIVPKGKGYVLADGRELPQAETYRLCRCGRSKNPPFCDGEHTKCGFKGTEIASRASFSERAGLMKGPGIDLLDDRRCALARFCHREQGDVWELVETSDNLEHKREAILGSCECPAGRLVAVEKDGTLIEPELEPSIEIVQDPELNVSSSISVKAYIPIESADGQLYERRNRVSLCRCGMSSNMPFCDATHVLTEFSDGHIDGQHKK